MGGGAPSYYDMWPLKPIREMFNSDEEYLKARNLYLEQVKEIEKEFQERKRLEELEVKIITAVVLAFGIVFLTGFAITLYIKGGLIPFIAILLFASLTLFIFKLLKE